VWVSSASADLPVFCLRCRCLCSLLLLLHVGGPAGRYKAAADDGIGPMTYTAHAHAAAVATSAAKGGITALRSALGLHGLM
jgi:hypothetical protein